VQADGTGGGYFEREPKPAMTRVIALMALAALGLTEAPVHEPVHSRGAHPSPLCYCA